MKLFKKFVVSLLIVIMVFSGITPVFAGSNERREYLINFSKGKTLTEINSTDNLSYDDLRLLGLFLSNYYVPWNTGVGISTDEKDVKKKMSNALVKSCGFSNETVKLLVEAIFDMSYTTMKPLSIANGDINGNMAESTSILVNKGDVSIMDSVGTVSDALWHGNSEVISNKVNENYPDATLYSFYGCMTGGYCDVRGVWSKPFADDAEVTGDERFYLFWTDESGTKHPVWEMDKGTLNSSDIEFTPCTASYLLMLNDADVQHGNAGNALLSVTEKAYKALSTEKQEKASMWNAQLYVDCFGNILCDVGTQLYVVVPACNNPYSWYSMKDGVSSLGDRMQLLNFFNIGRINAGDIVCKSNNFTESNGFYTIFENGGGDFQYNFNNDDDGKNLYSLDYFRINRTKSKEILKVDSVAWYKQLLGAKQSELKDFLKNGESGVYMKGSKIYFPNFKSFNSNIIEGNADHRGAIGNKIEAYSDMVMIDTYEAYKGSDDDPTSIPRTSIFHKEGSGDSAEFKCISSSISNNSYHSLTEKDNVIANIDVENREWVVSIFLSYYLAYENADGVANDKVCYAFNKQGLPAADSKNVDFSGIEVKASQEEMQTELQSMMYYMAHPSKGVSYVSSWFKTKIGGILVSWHEDMVGKSSAAYTTGHTKYLGFSGYITLPTLTDVPFTAWLLDNYMNIVVYIIIAIFIILLSYCVIGQMSFQRAVIGTVLFLALALLPPLAINGTATAINNACDKIYGNKFTYWALVQHQQYLSKLNGANLEESKADYLKAIFNEGNSNENAEDVFTSVKLKWMAPKKDNVQVNVENELKNNSTNKSSLTIMRNAIKNQMSGEEYTDRADALYLYRDYADIYMYSSIAYRCSSNKINTINKNSIDFVRDDHNRDILYSSGKDMFTLTNNIEDVESEVSLAYAQDKGFVINTTPKISSNNKCFGYLLDSGVATSLLEQQERIQNDDQTIHLADLENSAYGIPNEKYNLTIANIQKNCTPDGTPLGDASDDQAKLGYFYYGLYTESPFYFFTWNIYDQCKSSEYNCGVSETSSGDLVDLYTVNNQSYFYNYSENAAEGFGEMRDYCNMRSLFYYVIPYLKSANSVVLEWDKMNSLKTYEDVRLEYAEDGETVLIPDFNAVDENGIVPFVNGSKSVNLKGWCAKDDNGKCTEVTDEYIAKWWHNYNVERLFNVYAPWVDALYDCDFAKPETIEILGEKYTILDPLDPTSYYETDELGEITSGRPMIFSRSEMGYYGLTEADLTTVEQKIINVQDKVYADLLQLMDYYNFNDDVLITSAGMLTTFAFNQEFSQAKPFGESICMYPLSYELKAFSYDAYLRLILAETTGEDLRNTTNSTNYDSTGEVATDTGEKSFYLRVVENSSITTGLLYIILDILAVYAIPTLRFFFLIALFIMSIAMLIAAAVDIESNMVRTTWNSLISPLFKFTIVSLCLAWFVALFMSNGNTAVTNRSTIALSLGDPAMVLLVMIVANGVALILYYKICKESVKHIVRYIKALGSSITGAVAGAFGGAAMALLSGGREGRNIKKNSDSAAGGTAKARGRRNTPHAGYSGEDDSNNIIDGVGTNGYNHSNFGYSMEGNPKAGGVATPQYNSHGGYETDEQAAKKAEKYNSMSKEQGDTIFQFDKEANREIARANTLAGGEYKARADEISRKRQANKSAREANLKRIDEKKRLGEKLTLEERTYAKRMDLSDRLLERQQTRYTKQAGKMAKKNKREINKCNSRAEIAFTTARTAQAQFSGESAPSITIINQQFAERKREVQRVQGRIINSSPERKTKTMSIKKGKTSKKSKPKARNKRIK